MQAVMKHVYHYSAERQVGHILSKYDGIIHYVNPLTDMDDYRKAKQLIVGDHSNPVGLVITSLSYLGQHEVSELGPESSLPKAPITNGGLSGQ